MKELQFLFLNRISKETLKDIILCFNKNNYIKYVYMPTYKKYICVSDPVRKKKII